MYVGLHVKCTSFLWNFNETCISFSFTYIFIWVRKLDFNSLTKTKNWSGRNEVTETSGRLHPLWPQHKRLHTPRTADYRHARQDRWIQTELVSTLAKNVTKPNPFEIILLQTTRKENNWKTKETLDRAVVTLETERIKGSRNGSKGPGTDQRVQSLVFMTMMIMMMHILERFSRNTQISNVMNIHPVGGE